MKKSTIARKTPQSTVASASGDSGAVVAATGAAGRARRPVSVVSGRVWVNAMRSACGASQPGTRRRSSWYRHHLAPGEVSSQTECMTSTETPLSATTAPRVPAVGRRSTDAQLRRRELGAFLRSRRERLTPADVGLPQSGRRRTPGLRREEVASLAGVGMTWYTWLEQGRDINASGQVLEAIARTLLLDAHERTHLYTLAGVTPPGVASDGHAITPQVRAAIDRLHPFPAFVSNGRYDLLAYNRAYQALIGDLDALPVEERNSLWIMFTKRTTARCFVDREQAKPRMV